MTFIRFRDFLTEQKISWSKEWNGDLDSTGKKKVYDYVSSDGRWKIELTGYYRRVGHSRPGYPNHTSWAIWDIKNNKNATDYVFSNVAKAKKKVDELVAAELKESLEEKSVSKSQQRLMGMALAYKKGELDNASDEVKKLANSMSMKDLEDYAKTKHDDLPDKKESIDVEEANAKSLSISQRRKAGRRLKRLRTRIKVARKRALKRTPNIKRLKSRAGRAVRNQLFKKFSKGKSRKDVSMSRRGAIERRIDRLSKQRIRTMKVKQVRKSRKLDRDRRSGKGR